MKKTCVYYSDFGAVGDGVTNDFFAMKRAHEYANENALSVKGEAGKTYYIGSTTDENGNCSPIEIKTDTDFCGATIVIDDTDISWSKDGPRDFATNIFNIVSDYPYEYLDKDALNSLNSKKDEDGLVIRAFDRENPTKKLNLKLGYPAFLVLYNYNYNMYVRWGYVNSKGYPQREVVVIDEDGNLDKDTPFLFDYKEITQVKIQRLDVKPISVGNAKIISRASRINLYSIGHRGILRGFNILRPHTRFYDVEHIIEGEIPKFQPVFEDSDGLSCIKEGYTYNAGKIYDEFGNEYLGDDVKPFVGHGYSGIYQFSSTHNLLVENVAFQPRTYYLQGTYDILGSETNKIVFKNCTQNNFFDSRFPDKKIPNMSLCWGVTGTNFCKNMDYISCKLTRYDAHCGVFNGKIIDSEMSVLRLIGGGEFLVENTVFYNVYTAPFQLRRDYGATFNGTLSIKNCKILDAKGTDEIGAIIEAPNAHHDFGYDSHFPNVFIDNLEIETKKEYVDLIEDITQSWKETDHFPARNFLREDSHDPEALFTHYYETLDENGKQFTRITDKMKNVSPYIPPKFIKIINNGDKNYKLSLYKANFFDNTEIIANEDNLVILDLPKESKYH